MIKSCISIILMFLSNFQLVFLSEQIKELDFLLHSRLAPDQHISTSDQSDSTVEHVKSGVQYSNSISYCSDVSNSPNSPSLPSKYLAKEINSTNTSTEIAALESHSPLSCVEDFGETSGGRGKSSEVNWRENVEEKHQENITEDIVKPSLSDLLEDMLSEDPENFEDREEIGGDTEEEEEKEEEEKEEVEKEEYITSHLRKKRVMASEMTLFSGNIKSLSKEDNFTEEGVVEMKKQSKVEDSPSAVALSSIPPSLSPYGTGERENCKTKSVFCSRIPCRIGKLSPYSHRHHFQSPGARIGSKKSVLPSSIPVRMTRSKPLVTAKCDHVDRNNMKSRELPPSITSPIATAGCDDVNRDNMKSRELAPSVKKVTSPTATTECDHVDRDNIDLTCSITIDENDPGLVDSVKSSNRKKQRIDVHHQDIGLQNASGSLSDRNIHEHIASHNASHSLSSALKREAKEEDLHGEDRDLNNEDLSSNHGSRLSLIPVLTKKEKKSVLQRNLVSNYPPSSSVKKVKGRNSQGGDSQRGVASHHEDLDSNVSSLSSMEKKTKRGIASHNGYKVPPHSPIPVKKKDLEESVSSLHPSQMRDLPTDHMTRRDTQRAIDTTHLRPLQRDRTTGRDTQGGASIDTIPPHSSRPLQRDHMTGRDTQDGASIDTTPSHSSKPLQRGRDTQGSASIDSTPPYSSRPLLTDHMTGKNTQDAASIDITPPYSSRPLRIDHMTCRDTQGVSSIDTTPPHSSKFLQRDHMTGRDTQGSASIDSTPLHSSKPLRRDHMTGRGTQEDASIDTISPHLSRSHKHTDQMMGRDTQREGVVNPYINATTTCSSRPLKANTLGGGVANSSIDPTPPHPFLTDNVMSSESKKNLYEERNMPVLTV